MTIPFLAAVVALNMLGPAPVVVELFTSQGCSSCPPADEIVRTISRDASLRGRVIPLAFHVDYWNHLGWADPFSSREWSRRQMIYVRALHGNSAYTPQAVINGSVEFVGSRGSALASAISEASHRKPVGTLHLEARRTGNSVSATVHANAPPEFDVVIALFQNDVTTSIRAGENNGRTSNEDAIVRRLTRAGNGTVTLPVDPSWKNIGVVAFLQDRETLAIGNAASVILSRVDGEGSQNRLPVF